MFKNLKINNNIKIKTFSMLNKTITAHKNKNMDNF